jgi:Radical SAM superfamily
MSILKFRTANGKEITLNARNESTVIMEDLARSYTFDYGGRFVGAFREGRNYRRSFSNEIIEKQSGPRPGLAGRLRRTLEPEEVRALEVEAYDFAGTLSAELRQVDKAQTNDAIQAAQNALAHVNRFCYTSLEREREEYAQVYHPVTILPPDQYLALYLQMTEGCAFNQCTFCNFYHDRRFHIKQPEAFHEHIRRVRAFIGEGLSLRRSIFLGDANALMMPQRMLIQRFNIIHQEFDVLPQGLTEYARQAWRAAHLIHFDGIYSFIDAFSTKQKRAADFAALAELGLRRVYIGLESGDPDLLKFLGKPNTPDEVVRLVRECKEGGVAVGVIVLVGAGGEKFEHAHIQHTTELVNALPLDENDLIYLSELVDFPNSIYSQRAAAAGIPPMELEEIEGQRQILQDAFCFRDRAHAPRVSAYDIREFVY